MKDTSDWGLKDIEGFLRGIKPALYISLQIEPEFRPYKSTYPSISDPRLEERNDESFLFFQNQILKDRFLEDLKGIKDVNSNKFDHLLGLTLGFPPESVEYYIKPYGSNHDRILYHYGGLHFSGHIDHLLNTANWVWDKYGDIEETFKFSADLMIFEAEYRDFDGLNRCRDELKEIQKESLSPTG